MTARHPAKYSGRLLECIFGLIDDETQTLGRSVRVLDVFAGVGTIHEWAQFGPDFERAPFVVGSELEPEWAIQGKGPMVVADATALPFADGSIDVVGTSPAFGNRMCLVGESLVMTLAGAKPIKEVTPGELVLTHRGRWRRVTSCGPTGVKPTVELVGAIGGKLTCTVDHRLLVVANQNNRWTPPVDLGEPAWREAAECQGSYWLSPRTIEACERPPMPDGFTDDAAFWWMVGNWLADGWGYHGLNKNGVTWNRSTVYFCAAASKAFEAQDRLTQACGERLAKDAGHHTESVSVWRLYSRGLLGWLYEHFGHGAAGKNLPGWCVGLDATSRRSLLDGYLFGDGHATEKHGRPFNIATSVSAPMLRGFQLLAQSCGFSTNFNDGHKARREFVVSQWSECKASYRLATTFGATVRVIQHGPFYASKIRGITDAGLNLVYDLEVEEDHSFVANGIVVHNSDHHDARDASDRNTYTHALGRKLSRNNSGAMKWGPEYRQLHESAWFAAAGALRDGGLAIIDIKNHLETVGPKGKRYKVEHHVAEWHLNCWMRLGFTVHSVTRIRSGGLPVGENWESRTEAHLVMALRKPLTPRPNRGTVRAPKENQCLT